MKLSSLKLSRLKFFNESSILCIKLQKHDNFILYFKCTCNTDLHIIYKMNNSYVVSNYI